MPTTWQTVRVFISSTFRDMHAERDHLIKRVFPKLRERLEKYHIHLVDIDLRWGITEEESQRDRVLDLCLQQIDDCRPFFVGILGERYGWVPKTFSDEAVSKYGWVQHQTGKSVTELEILYGVLHNSKMHPHSIFLFRDPAFIAKVPEAIRTGLTAEDEESARKVQMLKQAIREANLPIPLLESYPCEFAGLRINWRLAGIELAEADRRALEAVTEDGIIDVDECAGLEPHLRAVVERHGIVYLDGLETFGHHIEEQLWQAIKAEHNLPDTPPAETVEDVDPLTAEQDYHERFIESRLRVYVGRETVQKRLTIFADGEDTHPCLVTGPSGSGKSAAMAKFASEYAQQHPDVLIIPHFIGASPGSTSLRQMLRRFCLILKARFALTEDVPQDASELIGRFRESLKSVPADARIVLVVDALNQLDETDNACSMDWLPWELPSRVKIVASCTDDPDRTEPVLEALSRRSLERATIELLTDDERREIVRRVPSLSAKTLDRRQVELLLSNPATKNPLFLLVALEELRGFGSFEQIEARIAAFPHEGDTVTAMFGQLIERLREEFDPEVVRPVLALIACSRSGMAERELLEMIVGIGVEETTSDLFPVLRQLRPYLQHRGELLDFFHRSLYKAVRQWYLPDDGATRRYRHDLVEYFAALRKVNSRKLAELPYQLDKVGDWQRLAELLTKPLFFIRAWGTSRTEVKRYWHEIERCSSQTIAEAYKPVLVSPPPMWEYLWCLGTFFLDMHKDDEAATVWRYLVENLKHRDRFQGSEAAARETARALGNFARALSQKGDLEEALRLNKVTEQMFTEVGDEESLARCLANQAAILHAQGKREEADRRRTQAEELFRKTGYAPGLSLELLKKAFLQEDEQDDPEGALATYREAEEMLRKLGDDDNLAFCLGGQARVLQKLGDPHGSLALYKMQEHHCRKTGDLKQLKACLGQQAQIMIYLDRIDEAKNLYREAKKI